MSEIREQIMATHDDHNLFSNEPLVADPSLTTTNSNLNVVPLSSLDKDEATSISQKLDNRAYLEKSPYLIDGHDHDNDDVHHEQSDSSNERRSGDITTEYDGSNENSHGLLRCSSATSITSNCIHSMGESSGSAPGENMGHTGLEKVWSNEQHNAYLDSMEENFVRDMYAHDYCSELCGNRPHSLPESESEASMVYTGTSSDIDEMMSNEEGGQCMEGSISSSSSSLHRSGKEKGSRHASTTTSSKTNRTRKRTRFPSFADSGPSNSQNIVQHHLLPMMDNTARLHKHATTLTNPIQYSSTAIHSNVKKIACQVVSCEEERSMKTLKPAGKKHPFFSIYYDQVKLNYSTLG